jgi:arsenate reductase (thioredoxin)
MYRSWPLIVALLLVAAVLFAHHHMQAAAKTANHSQTRPNILILCTGNSARSQMSEGFFRHYVGDRFNVLSAGMKPAARVNPFAIQAMNELGIDISGHQPKHANQLLGMVPIEYLITVCASADSECPAVIERVSHRMAWPFEDPAAIQGTDEEKLAGFRRIRDQIQERIKTWVESLPK